MYKSQEWGRRVVEKFACAEGEWIGNEWHTLQNQQNSILNANTKTPKKMYHLAIHKFINKSRIHFSAPEKPGKISPPVKVSLPGKGSALLAKCVVPRPHGAPKS